VTEKRREAAEEVRRRLPGAKCAVGGKPAQEREIRDHSVDLGCSQRVAQLHDRLILVAAWAISFAIIGS